MKNIPAELYPLIEWWEAKGKQTLLVLIVVALAGGAFYGARAWRENRRIEAAKILLDAYTTEELEIGVATYGDTSAGASLRLRLAKKYYDNENYEGALALYKELKETAPKGFEEIPLIGEAQCLEAMGDIVKSREIYDKFAEERPSSPLCLSAKLGSARVRAIAGEKDSALAALEELQASTKDNLLETIRINATIDLVKRWEKREAKTLLNAAEAVAKELEETSTK